jgi:hypothetical protein
VVKHWFALKGKVVRKRSFSCYMGRLSGLLVQKQEVVLKELVTYQPWTYPCLRQEVLFCGWEPHLN